MRLPRFTCTSGAWAGEPAWRRETMALLADEIRVRQSSNPSDGITGSPLQARYDGSAIDPDEIRNLNL